MGIAERRERQKAELRDTILAAAARIMADEGFSALTMRKIAEAIEYSPATIYLHFESRDEIAMQLVRDGFAGLLAHLEPAMHETDPLARLRAMARRYIDFAETKRQTYRLMFMEDARFADQILSRVKENGDADGGAFEAGIETVRSLIDDGTFRNDRSAETIASLITAALHGIASLKISCGDYPFSGDLAGPTEEMVDVLVRGLSVRD